MSDSWLHSFESRLEQLERSAAVEPIVFSGLFQHAVSALGTLAPEAGLRIWLLRPDSLERLLADGRTESNDPEKTPSVVAAADSDYLFETSTNQGEEISTAQSLFVHSHVAEHLSCVLEVPFNTLIAPRQSFIDGARAVCQIMAGFVGRHLLSQYEGRMLSQIRLTEFVSQLHQAETLRQAASVLAQDGASVLGAARVAVLLNQAGRFRLWAVTGVRDPNPDSETVRALTNLAKSDKWSEWGSLKDMTDGAEAAALAMLSDQGTERLRILKLPESADAAQPVSAVITIELLRGSPEPPEQVIEQLKSAADHVLGRYLSGGGRLTDRLISRRHLVWLLATAAIATVLAFWPTQFEVEVPGRLVSVNHRRIFAPEHGTVDEVLFQHEQVVKKHQLLLQMSNSDLDLELRRVEGEIDTTGAELAAVQARRVTGGDAELSGKEQQLKLRKSSLEEQLSLLQSRAAELNILAPFAGTVFHHDPQRELLARPVQRGQLLLEIVPTDATWELELSVPDQLQEYVRLALAASEDAPKIRYMSRAVPDQDWTTTLTSLEDAVQIVDGTMVCRATARLATLPDPALRPGTSVTARIACGRRAIGFVWFREVIEFWQQIRFAWF